MLSPITQIPIRSQDSIIEVVHRDGEFDEAFITTTLELAKPLTDKEEGETFLLPMSQDGLQRPIMRYVGDAVDDPTATMTFDTEVDRSEADQQVVEALDQLQEVSAEVAEAHQQLAGAIKQTAASMSTTTLRVRQGQTRLRYFTTVKVPKAEDGTYTFETLAPLATFILQNGGQIRVVALLPAGANKQEAIALQVKGEPNTAIKVDEAVVGARTILGWKWQTDPYFRITYKY